MRWLMTTPAYTVKITFKEAMNELPFLTMMNRYFYVVPEHIYGQYTMAELNEAQTWKDNMAINRQAIVDNLLEGEGMVLYAPFSNEPSLCR